MKFDRNGNYLTQWAISGSGFIGFQAPGGIAVDSAGNYIYATDFINHRIEVFANFAPPTLTISLTGARAVMSWSEPLFSLQAAPTVAGPYANVPGAASPCTNVITGTQQFFRLMH